MPISLQRAPTMRSIVVHFLHAAVEIMEASTPMSITKGRVMTVSLFPVEAAEALEAAMAIEVVEVVEDVVAAEAVKAVETAEAAEAVDTGEDLTTDAPE